MSKRNWRDPRFTCELFCVTKEAENRYVDEPEVKVVDTFRVKNYQEAIDYTKAYREEHKADGWTYYWRQRRSSHSLGDFGLWHCDGICSWGASDVDCVFIDWVAKVRVKLRKEKDYTMHKDYIRKIARIRRLSACKVVRACVWLWLKFWDNLTWYCWDKPKNKFVDWRWDRRNIKNWKKTGHALNESWSLELHLLDDLKYNLKKLNEEGYGINTEFMYDVIREQHATEPDFDIEKKMSEIMMNSNRKEADKVEKLAVERQKQTYDHICHLVDLYTFYVNQEVDGKAVTKETFTPDMDGYFVECTYNNLDYKRMLDDAKKVWNEIWDLVKKYGQQMGD